jgi:hypothetical protein
MYKYINIHSRLSTDTSVELANRQSLTYVHYLIKSIRTSLCNSKLKPRCHYDRTYRYKGGRKLCVAHYQENG